MGKKRRVEKQCEGAQGKAEGVNERGPKRQMERENCERERRNLSTG